MHKSVILLTSSFFNKVAIKSKLTNQRIDLAQAQRQLRVVFQIAANEAIFASAGFQRYGASIVGGSQTVLFNERKHAQDAANGYLPLIAIHRLAEYANVRTGLFGAPQ